MAPEPQVVEDVHVKGFPQQLTVCHLIHVQDWTRLPFPAFFSVLVCFRLLAWPYGAFIQLLIVWQNLLPALSVLHQAANFSASAVHPQRINVSVSVQPRGRQTTPRSLFSSHPDSLFVLMGGKSSHLLSDLKTDALRSKGDQWEEVTEGQWKRLGEGQVPHNLERLICVCFVSLCEPSVAW